MASGSISANFLTVEHLFIITGTGLRYDALTMFYVGSSGTLVGTRFIDLFGFNRLIDPSTLQYSLTSSLISLDILGIFFILFKKPNLNN